DTAIWTRMGIRPPAPSLPDQRRTLMGALHDRLAIHGELHLQAEWFPNLTEPALSFTSKIGFIHAVWLAITQKICGLSGFCTCNGCGWPYMREHQARAGQGNYCPVCQYGKGAHNDDVTYRASKRRYAQRKRALQRQARQFYTEGFTYEKISQQLKPSAGRMK